MFELISQIPFHFTTSLCSLMDPIYYIYHKLYHIFSDHVGQCHQARSVLNLGAQQTVPTLTWGISLFWSFTIISSFLYLANIQKTQCCNF